jgi:outer membrane protein assembly factor BamA
LTYSSEGQQAYRFNWRRWTNHRDLPSGGVIQDERTFLHVTGGYRKTLTRRFFGIGPDTREIDESSYTDQATHAEVYYQTAIPDPADNLIGRFGLLAEHHNLAEGEVSGRPTTQGAFPEFFFPVEKHDLLWAQAQLAWDTRDSPHNPYNGWVVGAKMDAAVAQTGGETGTVFGVFGSTVLKVPPLLHDGGEPGEEHPPTDVIAVGGQVAFSTGDLPFYSLPSLGGSRTLRGYIGNRWTDRAVWHVAAEYRFWFLPRGFALDEAIRIERLGLALFVDIGSVADDVESLRDAKMHTSYGLSFRLSLERTALFRFDYGISREDSILSIAYGLTF